MHVVPLWSPLLPDAVVGLVPPSRDGSDHVLDELPDGISDRFVTPRETVRELYHRSEHIELHLLVGGVADANRAAAQIPVECREDRFGQELVAGERVERPKLFGAGQLADPFEDPGEQGVRLGQTAQFDQCTGAE